MLLVKGPLQKTDKYLLKVSQTNYYLNLVFKIWYTHKGYIYNNLAVAKSSLFIVF